MSLAIVLFGGTVAHSEGIRIRKQLMTGGSARRFYRVSQGHRTYILICGLDLVDYLNIQRHLRRRGICVPRVIKVMSGEILIEDLGDHSLYSLMQRTPRNWRVWYRPVIRELVRMQILGRKRPPIRCRYDDEHMRWEQDYFREHFLKSYCGYRDSDLRSLADDLKRLRLETAKANRPFEGFFMHRDFQSQNIIFKNRRPRFIDFQSARIGPLTYDLASLLRDPYVALGPGQEQELQSWYLKILNDRGLPAEPVLFHHAYELTSIQRIMQALGAFANLGLNKNKPHFLSHIPRGVVQLKRGMPVMPLPRLAALINEAFPAALTGGILDHG